MRSATITTIPISCHIELYKYWDAKRNGRQMPARADIDPVEVPRLLGHISIIDLCEGYYRWRLMGSSLADDFGRDLTGQKFGGYFAASSFVDALIATFDRVLSTGQPIFEESVYETPLGAAHFASRLLLPLCDQQGDSRMIIFTRITRFGSLLQRYEEQDRLRDASGGVCGTFEIKSCADLQAQLADWEQKVSKV